MISFMLLLSTVRDEAIREVAELESGGSFGSSLSSWLRPDLVPPAPFLQCKPHLTPGGSGVLV